MEKLRDIKDLMVIEEYSLYIFIAIVLISLLLLSFIVKKLFFRKIKKSPIQIAKENLCNLDFSNSKKSSYKLSKYMAFLLEEEEFKKLEKTLVKYKYKKTVLEFLKEDLEEIKSLLVKYNV